MFSILIANYNNAHFINDCFNSILKQSYQNFEVIIVDDASTDNSIEIINKFIDSDKRFILYQNKINSGCGFTKSRCAAQANGDICGFVDPDDTIEPDALDKMVLAHVVHVNASIITSKYFLVDLKLENKNICSHGENVPDNFSYLTYGRGALTHFATFKSSFYKKTEGISPIFTRAVDQDLYYKLEEVGKHYFLDEVLYNYRINQNSISCNKNLYKAQYWHFIAIRDAHKRRKKISGSLNFSKSNFKEVEFNYWKSRLIRDTLKGNYKNKYYFLFLMTKTLPFIQIKYKLKCLLFIKYS